MLESLDNKDRLRFTLKHKDLEKWLSNLMKKDYMIEYEVKIKFKPIKNPDNLNEFNDVYINDKGELISKWLSLTGI